MMERTVANRIRLGIFVLVGTALLLIAVYLIGNRQNLFGNTFEISTVFKNVRGLQIGNNVRFSGVNVGTVSDIRILNDTAVQVIMNVDDEMKSHIRTNAIATVGSDGLVGSMILNILPAKGDAPLVSEGDELVSYSRIATEDLMNTLSVTNENAAMLTADLLKVTELLLQEKGAIGKLLTDEGMADDLATTISNLRSLSISASSSVEELNEVVRNIRSEESVAGVLLSDSLSGQRLKEIIANIDSSSTDIRSTSKDLKDLVSAMKNGDGAIDYVSTDTAFVRHLESTMKNVDEGTARFNENMEALKHNFLLRGYFKKKEKRARKEK